MNTIDFLKGQRCWYECVPHRATFSAQRLAQALHVPGRDVAKTVLLRANRDGGHQFVVAVLPATKQIDFHRIAQSIDGGKVELATELEIAAQCPDCEFGVLPPFGSQYGMKTVVDSSLTEDKEIWFEGTSHNEAVRMKFDDYQRLEEPTIAPFAQ